MDLDKIRQLIKKKRIENVKIQNKYILDKIEEILDELFILDEIIDDENAKIMYDDYLLQLSELVNKKNTSNKDNLIIEIRPGTGGDEAGIFAMDLFKMYSRYIEKKKWNFEILSMKSNGNVLDFICFRVIGAGVESRLKYESGVHRVQRVPDTESQGRIHTSTASVSVLSNLENISVDIKPEDIRKEVCRASGAGGQHVNKTESAVRLVHIETGIVVTCQDERSQLENYERALKILKGKIYEKKIHEYNSKRSSDRKNQIGEATRSEKFRTYNFPDNRITDHDFNFSIYNLLNIMSFGDLDSLIDKHIKGIEDSNTLEDRIIKFILEI